MAQRDQGAASARHRRRGRGRRLCGHRTQRPGTTAEPFSTRRPWISSRPASVPLWSWSTAPRCTRPWSPRSTRTRSGSTADASPSTQDSDGVRLAFADESEATGHVRHRCRRSALRRQSHDAGRWSAARSGLRSWRAVADVDGAARRGADRGRVVGTGSVFGAQHLPEQPGLLVRRGPRSGTATRALADRTRSPASRPLRGLARPHPAGSSSETADETSCATTSSTVRHRRPWRSAGWRCSVTPRIPMLPYLGQGACQAIEDGEAVGGRSRRHGPRSGARPRDLQPRPPSSRPPRPWSSRLRMSRVAHAAQPGRRRAAQGPAQKDVDGGHPQAGWRRSSAARPDSTDTQRCQRGTAMTSLRVAEPVIEVRDLTKDYGDGPGGGPRQLRCRCRHDHRLPRPERIRQEHHAADPRRPRRSPPTGPLGSPGAPTASSPTR